MSDIYLETETAEKATDAEHKNEDAQLLGAQVVRTIAIADIRAMQSTDNSWQSKSLCYDTDEGPEAFVGASKAPDQRRLIAKYCLNCPVLLECKVTSALEDATSTSSEIIGLQGGQTEKNRRLQARYNKARLLEDKDSILIFPPENGKPLTGLPPLPQKSEKRHELLPVNTEEEISYAELSELLGVGNDVISKIVRRENIPTAQHHDPEDGRKRTYIPRSDVERLTEAVKSRPRRKTSK